MRTSTKKEVSSPSVLSFISDGYNRSEIKWFAFFVRITPTVDIGRAWLCNMGDLERIQIQNSMEKCCCRTWATTMEVSERANVKFLLIEQITKHLQQMNKIQKGNYLVWICWWRVLLAWWRHDDAVWLYSTFEDFFSCATFVYRFASTNANSSSTIWYSHKLFVFRMAMKWKEKNNICICISGWKRK